MFLLSDGIRSVTFTPGETALPNELEEPKVFWGLFTAFLSVSRLQGSVHLMLLWWRWSVDKGKRGQMVYQLRNQAVIHQQDIFRSDLQKAGLDPDIWITDFRPTPNMSTKTAYTAVRSLFSLILEHSWLWTLLPIFFCFHYMKPVFHFSFCWHCFCCINVFHGPGPKPTAHSKPRTKRWQTDKNCMQSNEIFGLLCKRCERSKCFVMLHCVGYSCKVTHSITWPKL